MNFISLFIRRLISVFKKFSIFLIVYLVLDIVFFSLIPEDLKSKLYNNRAHRIKSFYYHHDFRPMSSFYDHWGYERYKIYTNSLGFKDKSNRLVEFKDRNILFIGDSFTEGVGIEYENTYVGLIEKEIKKKYKNIEILNAGVQSYSTSIYLSKIYHLLERKQMPITDIIIMVSGGDIFDDYYKYMGVGENYILNHEDQKNKYLIELINFYKSNTLIYQIITRITPPKVIPGLIKSIFNSKDQSETYTENELKYSSIRNDEIDNMGFLNHKDYSYLYSSNEFDQWGRKAIDLSMQNLKEIIKICDLKNIKLNILYLYEPVIILKKPNDDYFNYMISEFKKLENLSQNLKVNFIKDLYNKYNNSYEAYKNLFFINDIHWNKRGNLLVSNEILEKIDF